MKNVLTVGSIALDTIETPTGKVSDVIGGSAIYSGYAASYFSAVRIVGIVGDDFPDEELLKMNERKIDISGIQKMRGKTFRWSGMYHPEMNRRDTIYTHLNVFENFHPFIPDNHRNSKYIFLANIHPSLQMEVLDQVNDPVFVAVDTMNLWIETTLSELKELLRRVDLLLVNDSEAVQLSGESNIYRAAEILKQMGPKVVIIKKGEHGSLLFMNSSIFFAPAFPLTGFKDPTGAGDTFAGGLMGYLASVERTDENSLRRGIVYGTIMASFCVEEFSVDNLTSLNPGDIKYRYDFLSKMVKF